MLWQSQRLKDSKSANDLRLVGGNVDFKNELICGYHVFYCQSIPTKNTYNCLTIVSHSAHSQQKNNHNQ